MKSEIKECHEFLNDIYEKADIFLKLLSDKNINGKLNSYNKHYIKINGEYELQKYFMPVISIENKGDICFNLDGVSLEFFIDKEKLLLNDNILDVTEKYFYDLEVYSNENCLEDLYFKDISIFQLKENILNCDDNVIGITVNCQILSNDEIIKCFIDVCYVLNL